MKIKKNLSIAAFVVIFGITSSLLSCTKCSSDNSTLTSVKIDDVKVGEGKEAAEGSKVTVHYVGTLEDGTKFDSSRDNGAPFSFYLGTTSIIEGWNQGVKGMKVGGVRKLTIPPSLAYGEQALGVIPANSTLLFEIELLEVE